MVATYEAIDIDVIRKRVQHGLPITMDQTRWLVEQVSGKLPIKKRMKCKACHGEGLHRLPSGREIKCEVCTDGQVWIDDPKTKCSDWPVTECPACAERLRLYHMGVVFSNRISLPCEQCGKCIGEGGE